MLNGEIKIDILLFDRNNKISGLPETIKDYDLPQLSTSLEALREEIKTPLILDINDVLHGPISFYETDKNGWWSSLKLGWWVNDWIYQHFGKDRGFTGGIVDLFLSLATNDEEWTAWRNNELNYVCYYKITFFPEVIEAVEAEIDRIELDIQKAYKIVDAELEKQQAKAEQWEREKAEELDGVSWRIEEKEIYDDCGKTIVYTHHISFGEHRFTLTEDNVCDFGVVIMFSHMRELVVRKDSNDPTLYINKGTYEKPLWYKLNDAELKAYRIVRKYGKYVNAGIRM